MPRSDLLDRILHMAWSSRSKSYRTTQIVFANRFDKLDP